MTTRVGSSGGADDSAISLQGRVAVVTGAGAGLGRSHALALAARGASVLVNDVGAAVDGSGFSAQRADDVVEDIRARGGTAAPDYNTVATPEGGEAIIASAIREFGRIDVLVNNAGNIQISSFAKLDVTRIDEVLDVHLGGAFYVTQPAYRLMRAQRHGRIIFTLSGVATFGVRGASVYGAAKGAVMGLVNVLALEAAPHGVTVNAIAPMAQTRMAAGVDLPQYAQLTDQSVSPDLASPVVVFFAADECTETGEIWSVGAGAVAKVIMARSHGIFKHPDVDGPLTAEDVSRHVALICDVDNVAFPHDWDEEWNLVLSNFNCESPEL